MPEKFYTQCFSFILNKMLINHNPGDQEAADLYRKNFRGKKHTQGKTSECDNRTERVWAYHKYKRKQQVEKDQEKYRADLRK